MSAVPLPIYPFEQPQEVRDLVFQAIAALNLPYEVHPAPAKPGSPGRVLALGAFPDFVCDLTFVRPENVTRPESIRGAVADAIAQVNPPSYGVANYMYDLLGAREITDPIELQRIRDDEELAEMTRAAMAA